MRPSSCGWLLAAHLLLSVSHTAAQVNTDPPAECVGEWGAYNGTQNVTISGRTCQRWDVQRPHRQNCYLNLDATDQRHNFCRNPVSTDTCHRATAWCYTNDRFLQWEYCDVPVCGQSPGCDMALGMESGNITDEQITASYNLWNGNAHMARLNAGGAWLAGGRNQYLKIDLGALHTVTRLLVQGVGPKWYDLYTTSVKVLWSRDDLVWNVYSRDSSDASVLETNHGRLDTAPVVFNPPIQHARFIAIVPHSYSVWGIGLRLEVIGCPSGLSSSLPTIVTADIQASTRWDLAHSPYVIGRPLTVARGATLTIQAGVDVVFLTRTSGLVVEGCLRIDAVVGLDVRFQSNNPMGLLVRTALWEGITVAHSDCLPVILEGVHIAGANRGVYITSASSIQLSRVSFVFNNYGILYASSSPQTNTSSVDNCRFIDNWKGIAFTTSSHVSSFVINSCWFDKDSTSVEHNGNLNLTVVESYFTAASSRAISMTCPHRRGSTCVVTVARCLFSDAAVYINYGYYGTGSVYIADTTMTRRNAGLSITSSNSVREVITIVLTNISISENYRASSISVANATVHVLNSQFLYNRLTALELTHIGVGLRRVEVTGSAFIGNNIALRISQSGLTPLSRWTRLHNNTFINNTGPGISFGDLCRSSPNITANCFNNPTAPYDIQVMLPRECNNRSEYKTLVQGNWFPEDVRRRVYDFFVDLQRIEVALLGNYLDSGCTQLFPQEETRDFDVATSSETIGGRLTGDWVISAAGVFEMSHGSNRAVEATHRGVFYVNSTIHIPQGSSLTITEKVTLVFWNMTGILVEGLFTVYGTIENPVVFTSDGGTRQSRYWGGVMLNSAADATIHNLDCRYAQSCIIANGSSLTVVASTFSNCQNNGVYVTSHGVVELVDSSFADNGYGIRAINAENITVTGCLFTSNNNRAFEMSQVKGTVVIQNTRFTACKSYIIYILECSGQLQVNNCFFTQTQFTTYYGIYIDSRVRNIQMVGFIGDRAAGFAGDIALDDIAIVHGTC